MAYANNITRLAELAAQDYIRGIAIDGIDAASVLAGFDDESVVAPRIVCNCDAAEPDGHPDDAVWACQLEIQVVNGCDMVSADAHHGMAGVVFSQFMLGRRATADAISQARADFHCQDIYPTGQAKELKDRKWTSSLMLKAVCCGIDMG